MSVGSVWRKVAAPAFLMAVAYLNVSVRLMAASVTSMPLYKRRQVTIGKSGSKEGEVGEETDLTPGHLRFSFGSLSHDESQQLWS